jgi:DNA-binding Lrp family transcriptional regulator
MPKALVCINTDRFAAEEVLDELRACPNVEEAYRVQGAYDVIAKISGETSENLLDTVTNYIKTIRTVQTALTMLIVEPEKPAYEERMLIV